MSSFGVGRWSRFVARHVASVRCERPWSTPMSHRTMSSLCSEFTWPSGPRLSHVCGRTDIPLLRMTLGSFFDMQAQAKPNKEALVVRHENLRLTWQDLLSRAEEFAAGLLVRGFEKGDRLGVWMPNNSGWVIAQIAAAKLGLVLVHINPAYRLYELEHALNLTGCRGLVMAPKFKQSNYVEMMYQIAPELKHFNQHQQLVLQSLPSLRKIFLFHSSTWDPSMQVVGTEPFESVYLKNRPDLIDAVRRVQKDTHPDDPISLQFTSGTTGTPKAASLTHTGILNNGFLCGEGMKLTEKDKLCIPVPLYHCFGLVLGNLAAFSHHTTIVYPEEGFNAESVLQTVSEERCTALHGVPTMFIAELEHPNFASFDLSSLRTGIVAGSICPVSLMKKMVQHMHLSEITNCYGMTETSPVSWQSHTGDPIDKLTETVGTIHPHVECKVVDTEGQIVPVGAPGELWTRGYSVMKEYWNQPEKTREVITEDGYMKTGDMCILDRDGYLHIVGRSKDIIIRGGENIAPREVEDFLYTHPKVADVAIIGVPDRKYGEQIAAWVIPTKGQTITEEELISFCRDRIAHYKVPKYYHFVEEFPLTVTGKIQRYIIREKSIEIFGLENELK